ncbi:MAG: LLM class flavin-dependent oxidoreductase, partial [Chloroflexi bacterium]|nr:LLM class flavin-dependent oxidoreductase [Chloroflexota bacterium]
CGADSLRCFQAAGEDALPGPAQRRIPLWIGGMAAPVLERVATLGDGWLASSTTSADEFARGWAKIQELAGKLGRDAEVLTPAKFTYIHVDDDSDKALDLLKASLPRYYDFPYDAAKLAIYGPPDRCIERAQRLLDSGVRTLIFATVTQDLAQLNRLGRDVLPYLKNGN